jgi:predicted MPP superfamily phosphohydrolase
MKHVSISLISILLFLSLCSNPASQAGSIIPHSTLTNAGDILSVACSDPSPTAGEPVTLLVTVQGKANHRFNETVTVRDEFHGLTTAAGEMTWVVGNVIESQLTITIGRLSTYTKKIPWYPVLAGNHTLHITTGNSSEKILSVSVHFDVDGIIAPSFGHPSIISTDTMHTFQVTIAETRATTDPPAQILTAELAPVNGSPSTDLDAPLTTWRTRVNAGPDLVQDELIATYDISTIPNGFYDLTVETTTQNRTWPHAVKIQDTEPSSYTIVQLTDIHIGKYSNTINERQQLADLITFSNTEIHPDFVILTGDSVDWYNEKYKRNAFNDLRDVLLTCDAPVFTTPGNHERYGNSLLFLYYPFTNLTPYHRFLSPVSDSAFEYGGVNFVLLDSGYEYSRVEIQRQIWNTTPESSGLTNTQIYLLENVWGAGGMHQVIAMHHPAVNDRNDTSFGAVPNTLPSGNDECIAFNRGAFIDYCVNQNVSLVLAGHTHEEHVLNALGKPATNATAFPLFVQTRSSTLSGSDNGGRVLYIQNGVVLSYEYVAFH